MKWFPKGFYEMFSGNLYPFKRIYLFCLVAFPTAISTYRLSLADKWWVFVIGLIVALFLSSYIVWLDKAPWDCYISKEEIKRRKRLGALLTGVISFFFAVDACFFIEADYLPSGKIFFNQYEAFPPYLECLKRYWWQALMISFCLGIFQYIWNYLFAHTRYLLGMQVYEGINLADAGAQLLTEVRLLRFEGIKGLLLAGIFCAVYVYSDRILFFERVKELIATKPPVWVLITGLLLWRIWSVAEYHAWDKEGILLEAFISAGTYSDPKKQRGYRRTHFRHKLIFLFNAICAGFGHCMIVIFYMSEEAPGTPVTKYMAALVATTILAVFLWIGWAELQYQRKQKNIRTLWHIKL